MKDSRRVKEILGLPAYARNYQLSAEQVEESLRSERIEQIKTWLTLNFTNRRILAAAASRGGWNVPREQIEKDINIAKIELNEEVSISMEDIRNLIASRLHRLYSVGMAIGDLRTSLLANQELGKLYNVAPFGGSLDGEGARPFARLADDELDVHINRLLSGQSGGGKDTITVSRTTTTTDRVEIPNNGSGPPKAVPFALPMPSGALPVIDIGGDDDDGDDFE